MRKVRSVFWALSLVALSATAAHAQRFGAQLDWGTDSDLGIGARVEFPIALASEGILAGTYLIGSFDYFFPDCESDLVDCSYFEFNGNVAAPVQVEGTLKPYVGAGLNMARASVDVQGVGGGSDTQLGLNLLGGLRFAIGSLSSFAEARVELSGGEQFVVTWGIMLGRNR